MPHYISAYDLQQDDGLSRGEVIERAKTGPAYWKAQGEELFQPDVTRGHFADGFKRLQDTGTNLWKNFLNACKEIKTTWDKMENTPIDDWEEDWTNGKKQLDDWFGPLRVQRDALPKDSHIDPYEEYPDMLVDYAEKSNVGLKRALITIYQDFCATNLRLCLADILPSHIKGKAADALYAWKPSMAFSQQPEDEFGVERVLNAMNFHQLLYLSNTPAQANVTENIWVYLQYGSSQILDLIFERIFIERLAFDADNLPKHASNRSGHNNNLATAIESGLDSTPGLTIPERRYCVALIARLRGKKYADAYSSAYETSTTDHKGLDKQGRNYCREAIKAVKKKMGIVIDPNCIKGKV